MKTSQEAAANTSRVKQQHQPEMLDQHGISLFPSFPCSSACCAI